MTIEQTLELLGYHESPNYLTSDRDDWSAAADCAHILRRAAKDCDLRGVYLLRPSPESYESIVPVVYVCEAPDESAADAIHRSVWNQNIVPFLLVQTPKLLRLYTGFRYRRPSAGAADDMVARGVLDAAIAFNEVADRLNALRAESIDDGSVWKAWGDQVTPKTRVDWQLLEHLRLLDDLLCNGDGAGEGGLNRARSHALIGKFVYLYYLRHRGILSNRKLAKWNINPDSLFTRNATLKDFWAVNQRLDKWLNGAVFPLDPKAEPRISATHLIQVAGVFAGDTPAGQLHLDFQAYDFSFIPIETLSVIYEQFLHTPEREGDVSRGKQEGAYYTPIPLVNFILDELDTKRRLEQGMKVLDSACGSGAFLVQCYRRLIERQAPEPGKERLRPGQLRDVLTDHIFGVDRDGDACQVAEFSLILTLLDYVEPPDLENKPRFQLPVLRDRNIFEADFFDPNSNWAAAAEHLRFDWVVGNPPWITLSSEELSESNMHAWQWMQEHASQCPVGGYQLAEAFARKALHHLDPEGVVGLLLPAMTLFKKESRGFRRELFGQNDVWCVANFANLAYVLFAGRAQRPAAAVFYRPLPARSGDAADSDAKHAHVPLPDRGILTYAPFVINQEANRPSRPGRKKETWSIIINSSEMREVPVREAATGSTLPWKIAMWGSHRDLRLLERVESQFPDSHFETFCKQWGLQAHEGAQLRTSGAKDVELVSELIGKKRVDFRKLRKCGRIFSFHPDALPTIEKDHAYLRLRAGKAGLPVSRPPHIVVDAARRFAVYSDEFIGIPARQIGIAGPEGSGDLLRALSLYLCSDFAVYHQFLTCPEWGISTNRATLDGLKALPVPLGELGQADLQEWAQLQQSLASASSTLQAGPLGSDTPNADAELARLVDQMNALVLDVLDLRESERMLIHDLVNVRMKLVHGKVTSALARPPSNSEMHTYLGVLAQELNTFLQNQPGLWHEVAAVLDRDSAMVSIDLRRGPKGEAKPTVVHAGHPTARQFEKVRKDLRQRHGQWIYFDRGLRVYEGSRTYLFKPMQRLHWTRTQALLDAGEVIAETLVGAGVEQECG